MARRADAFFRNAGRCWAGAVAAWMLVLTASPAQATPEDDAEVFVKKGIALRKQGKDFDALAEFQRAYDIVQTPRTTGQLGLVEFALSRWEPAEEHMTDALKATADPWIAKNRAVLERSLKTIVSHIGQIELRGDPAGAIVIVNGRERGTLPLARPIRVGEGFAEVELSKEGYRSDRRTLTIRGEFTEQLFMKLDRLPSPSNGVTALSPSSPPPTKDPLQKDEPSVSDRASEGSGGGQSTLRIVSYSLAGVGVAALAAGGVMSLKVRSLEKEVANATKDPASAELDHVNDQIKAGQRYQTLQWVGYGVGLAALAGGVTCWVLDRRAASANEGSVALLPALIPGGGAGTVRVTF